MRVNLFAIREDFVFVDGMKYKIIQRAIHENDWFIFVLTFLFIWLEIT